VRRGVLVMVASAVSGVSAGLLCGFVLSRVAGSSASGWGDLVGAVAGLLLGFLAAQGVLFVVVARLAGRSLAVGLCGAAALFPGGLVLLALLTNLGVPFPASGVAVWAVLVVLVAVVGAPRRGVSRRRPR